MKTTVELLEAASRGDRKARAELRRIEREDPEEWREIALYMLTEVRDAVSRYDAAVRARARRMGWEG